MSLTARQRRALEEICDTFCPPANGVPAARRAGGRRRAARRGRAEPARARATSSWRRCCRCGTRTRWARRRRRLRAASARCRASSASGCCCRWGDSRSPQRRAVFQALRKGALLFYYMLPGPGGARNPAWDEIGYDGPLGKLDGRAAEGAVADGDRQRRQPRVRRRDRRVGRRRRRRGRRARRGRARCRRDRVGRLLRRPGLRRLRARRADAVLHGRAAAPATTRASDLLAGSCLGGGTVVNYTTSFRTPDDVRDGVGLVRCARVHLRRLHGQPRRGVRAARRQPGAQRAVHARAEAPGGVRQARMARRRDAARGAPVRTGRECGYCGLGCRVGAKQSVVKTWLADAHAAGTRMIVAQPRSARDRRGRRARGAWRRGRSSGRQRDDPRARRDRRLRRDPHAGAAASARAWRTTTSASI